MGELEEEEGDAQILYLNLTKTQAHPSLFTNRRDINKHDKSFENWIIVYTST